MRKFSPPWILEIEFFLDSLIPLISWFFNSSNLFSLNTLNFLFIFLLFLSPHNDYVSVRNFIIIVIWTDIVTVTVLKMNLDIPWMSETNLRICNFFLIIMHFNTWLLLSNNSFRGLRHKVFVSQFFHLTCLWRLNMLFQKYFLLLYFLGKFHMLFLISVHILFLSTDFRFLHKIKILIMMVRWWVSSEKKGILTPDTDLNIPSRNQFLWKFVWRNHYLIFWIVRLENHLTRYEK